MLKRRSFRFKGEIPLEIKQGTGITRDLSADGLYFYTDKPVFMGERMELVLRLDHQRLVQRVKLHCQADVARIEPGRDKVGVAVTITRHRVETAGDTGGIWG